MKPRSESRKFGSLKCAANSARFSAESVANDGADADADTLPLVPVLASVPVEEDDADEAADLVAPVVMTGPLLLTALPVPVARQRRCERHSSEHVWTRDVWRAASADADAKADADVDANGSDDCARTSAGRLVRVAVRSWNARRSAIFFADSYSLNDAGQKDSWFTDSNASQTRDIGNESGEGARRLSLHDDDGLQREYYDVLSPHRRVPVLPRKAGGAAAN
jgi:hypothetical protein